MEARVADPVPYAAEIIDLMTWIINGNVQAEQIRRTIAACKYIEAQNLVEKEPLADQLTYLLETYDGGGIGDLVETVKGAIETTCDEWEGVNFIRDSKGTYLPRYQVEALALRHVLEALKRRPLDPELPRPENALIFVQALNDELLFEWAVGMGCEFPRKAK